MKPHEETWAIDEQDVRDGDYTAIDAEGFGVLTTWARGDLGDSDAVAEGRLRLATAAPEMARALRFMLDAFPNACASREEADARAFARDVLHKAGVPLP